MQCEIFESPSGFEVVLPSSQDAGAVCGNGSRTANQSSTIDKALDAGAYCSVWKFFVSWLSYVNHLTVSTCGRHALQNIMAYHTTKSSSQLEVFPICIRALKDPLCEFLNMLIDGDNCKHLLYRICLTDKTCILWCDNWGPVRLALDVLGPAVVVAGFAPR